METPSSNISQLQRSAKHKRVATEEEAWEEKFICPNNANADRWIDD